MDHNSIDKVVEYKHRALERIWQGMVHLALAVLELENKSEAKYISMKLEITIKGR